MATKATTNSKMDAIHNRDCDPQSFRKRVRSGDFCGPTNGKCPGFLQCNLVVLRKRDAQDVVSDFLLFCHRNKKACPLVEVCDVGSAVPRSFFGKDVNLKTDIPKYAIYQKGKLVKEVKDVTDYWPEDSVAFLIGCSFTCEEALLEAGISLRSIEQNKNVPMYKTNLKCEPAGLLSGNMVVSMRPVKALDIALEVEVTSRFPHAHGAPVCIGCPSAIGINDIMKPDWGDSVEILSDELPVFHACGVTPQNVLMNSKVEFVITHSAGHMFVSDLHADAEVLKQL